MANRVLNVQMLGGFGLQIDGTSVKPVPSRSASSLLAFLIIHRDRAQTRDLLAGRFWPNLPEDKARRRLSHALWQIQSVADAALAGGEDEPDPVAGGTRADDKSDEGVEGLLERTPQTVQLNPRLTVVVDAEVFQRRLDEVERRYRTQRRGTGGPDLASVVDSYHGDLLSGHYDEWIDDQRKRVRDRYLAALDQLVQMNVGQADYESALRYARALVAAEPFSEEWHRAVIRLHALNGHPTAALRHFEEYREAAFRELGTDPDPATAELIERVVKDAASPAVVVDTPEESLPFIGRAAERSALLGRVNELVSGKGGVVLVEGDPGMGKSRLMEEVAQGAEWRGVQVLVGGHSPTSVLSPYQGLRETLTPATTGLRGERVATHLAPIWLTQAATVLEGLEVFVEPTVSHALRPEEEPWRIAEALTQVVLAQANPKPTLLILEDVHWSDEESMGVLVQLGDRLIDSGVLVCLTYQRTVAESAPTIWQGLGELEAKPGSSRLVLGPLTEEEIRRLVTSELGPGRISEPGLQRLIASAGGNPYAILELIRSPLDTLEDGFLNGRGFDSGPEVDVRLLPPVREILSQRIESTGDEIRLVLQCVAALAAPVSSRIVALVADLDRANAIAALADAVEAGFLVEGPRGAEFAHGQTRLAVYEELRPNQLSQIHGRIVDALVNEADVDVGRLAHHAWLAERWPEAHRFHTGAAEQAVLLNAFQTTAEHLAKADQAARSAGLADRDRIDELFAYEGVLEVLGRRPAQQELLDRLVALGDADPLVMLRARQRQAWFLANTDRGAEAAELAAAAIEQAHHESYNTGELLTILGSARAWSGDLNGAIEPLEAAIVELEAGGLSTTRPRLMLGRTYNDLFNVERARQYLEEAYSEAKENDDARSRVEALGHLATLYHTQNDEVGAEAAFQEALSLAADIGYRHGEGVNLVNLAAFYALIGRSGRALPLVARAAEVFASLGNGRGEAFVKHTTSELAHFYLGDDERAHRLAEEAAVYFRSVGDQWRETTCLITLARIDRRHGRRRMARRRLLSALSTVATAGDPSTVAKMRLELALVELELGHHQVALDETAVAGSLLEAHGVGVLGAALFALEAKAMVGLGRTDEAVALVHRAISHNRPRADRAHVAAWWCAEVLTAAGEERAAGEQVALAHELLSRHLEGVSEAEVEASWHLVPEHRAIAEARELHFVETVECRLPSFDAPTGRPLRADDYLPVTLTVSDPGDWMLSTAKDRRQERVLRLLTEAADQGAAARVADLAELLNVSGRTIKRDLAQLRLGGNVLPLLRSPEKPS